MKIIKTLGFVLVLASLVGAVAPEASAKAKGRGNSNAAATVVPPTATATTAPSTTTTTTAPPATTSSQPTSAFACSGGLVTSNPLAGGSSLSYSQCMTSSGNDVSSSIATNLGDFLNSTLGDWVFDGKYEGNKNASGPNDYGFSWVQTGNGSGTWSLAQAVTTPFVISLKAGNAYTAYYFDGTTSFDSGTWATFDKKDLSHASFFVGRGGLTPEPPNTTVPEPASAAALALVGLSAIGLRRKQQA